MNRSALFRFYRSLIASSAIVVAVVATSGCSSTGSGSADPNGDGSLSETDLNSREGRFGNGSIPTAEGEGLFHDIHFGYDSYSIDDEGRQDIAYNAKVLEQKPELKLMLEGHCDQRGTAEYNMALGAERARAVKNALASLGVSSSRLDTVSYGAEVPLDTGNDEMAYAKNRRVHLSATGGGRRKTDY